MKQAQFPHFVTHYHLPDRRPFLNLSDLAPAELDAVLAQLATSRGEGRHARVFGRRYMELRRLTEEKLRQLFVRSGGEPRRAAPHYFTLGESRWFEGLAIGMKSVILPLASLPDEHASFTYPDSFTAMGLASAFSVPYEWRPYHERVFRLNELQTVIDRYGIPRDDPTDDYAGYASRPFERYVEVQLWSDEPIRSYLI